MTNLSSPLFDLTTLGEIMLRFSVPAGQRLADLQQLDVHPGGAEGNVCSTLAGLGRRCAWMSRLPDNPLGRMVVRRLRAAGIDTGGVVLAKEARMGAYYVEFASPPRPIQVIYDRADSAMANMTIADVDWNYLLNSRIVHLTGITPALSETCLHLVQEVIERARSAEVPISFDINYRSLLWSEEKAAEVLCSLITGIDLLICGRGDAQNLFGLTGKDRDILAALKSLTQAKCVVLTLGDSGAMALDEGRFLQQSAISAQVIDRLGAGDAFAAGVLDGWLDGSLAEGLRRGTTLGALALAQHGDMLITNRTEMDNILASAEGGIVR